jgi:DNA-binding transcriptional MerR regulator
MRKPQVIYLTSLDVARRLGIGPERVRQLARAGALEPRITAASGVRLFASTDVDRYQRHGKKAA